jgi:predicted adenine nucleotide alpha hydrolase (AANH) superfamily ATPase
VTAYFHNPNIHPYREFRKRLRAAEVAAEARKIKILADDCYGLQTYLDEILPAGDARCRACYDLRLSRTAEAAREGDFDAFTTTLLASAHQKHEEVKAAGEAAARAASVNFIYRDWRDRMDAGVQSAKKRSLYRQQYCGCIWSEYERFGPRAGAGE